MWLHIRIENGADAPIDRTIALARLDVKVPRAASITSPAGRALHLDVRAAPGGEYLVTARAHDGTVLSLAFRGAPAIAARAGMSLAVRVTAGPAPTEDSIPLEGDDADGSESLAGSSAALPWLSDAVRREEAAYPAANGGGEGSAATPELPAIPPIPPSDVEPVGAPPSNGAPAPFRPEQGFATDTAPPPDWLVRGAWLVAGVAAGFALLSLAGAIGWNR